MYVRINLLSIKKKRGFDVGFYLAILLNEMLTIFLSSNTVGSWF